MSKTKDAAGDGQILDGNTDTGNATIPNQYSTFACEGADCQGCDDCPQTPLSEIFGKDSIVRVATAQEVIAAFPVKDFTEEFEQIERELRAELAAIAAEDSHGDGCFCEDCQFARTQVEPEPQPVYYRSFALKDWLAEADEKVTWHIPILCAAGTITLLSAGPKAGKTSAVWSFLSELQRFGTVLGERALPGLRVEMWTEENRVEVKQHSIEAHFDLTDIPDEWAITSVGDLEDRDWPLMVNAAIAEWKITGAPDVLIVDTIGEWALNEDWNDYAKTIKVLTPLRQINAAFPRMGILVAHHNRKAAGDAVDAASGSNALTGKVSNVVNLDKTDACDYYTRRLRFMGRVRPDGMDKDLYIRFDPETGTYTKERKGRAKEDAILEVLPDYPDMMTAAEIADAAIGDDGNKLSKRTVESTLKVLFSMGRVAYEGRGVKNDPKRYWATEHD